MPKSRSSSGRDITATSRGLGFPAIEDDARLARVVRCRVDVTTIRFYNRNQVVPVQCDKKANVSAQLDAHREDLLKLYAPEDGVSWEALKPRIAALFENETDRMVSARRAFAGKIGADSTRVPIDRSRLAGTELELRQTDVTLGDGSRKPHYAAELATSAGTVGVGAPVMWLAADRVSTRTQRKPCIEVAFGPGEVTDVSEARNQAFAVAMLEKVFQKKMPLHESLLAYNKILTETGKAELAKYRLYPSPIDLTHAGGEIERKPQYEHRSQLHDLYRAALREKNGDVLQAIECYNEKVTALDLGKYRVSPEAFQVSVGPGQPDNHANQTSIDVHLKKVGDRSDATLLELFPLGAERNSFIQARIEASNFVDAVLQPQAAELHGGEFRADSIKLDTIRSYYTLLLYERARAQDETKAAYPLMSKTTLAAIEGTMTPRDKQLMDEHRMSPERMHEHARAVREAAGRKNYNPSYDKPAESTESPIPASYERQRRTGILRKEPKIVMEVRSEAHGANRMLDRAITAAVLGKSLDYAREAALATLTNATDPHPERTAKVSV